MTTIKKRPLNIGLGKMLSQAQVTTKQNNSSKNQLHNIPLEQIIPGSFQPRKNFSPDGLNELAESIRAHGILQPIILRQIKPDQYEIIAGERRWRAAQIATLNTIPALIQEITNEAALAIGLIENIQRRDLNVLEQAEALARLLEEFKLTHAEIAQSLGKSRTMITNLLRLLQLENSVKNLLIENKIEMGHARALLSLPHTEQRALGQKIATQELSVRETEKLVKALLNPALKKSADLEKSDPDIQNLIRRLTHHLGTQIDIKHSKNGKGKIIISYSDLQVLDGILKKIS